MWGHAEVFWNGTAFPVCLDLGKEAEEEEDEKVVDILFVVDNPKYVARTAAPALIQCCWMSWRTLTSR